MSSVTSYNQAHIDAIDNAGIASGLVDANGHVILTKKGGGTIDVGSVVAPSGSLVMFAGAVTPTGWLLCNGAAVSRSTYAALFTAIGTAYGAGDGSTTFNLPNMEARFPRMQAAALGGTGGAASHNHTQAVHDHQLDGGSVAAHAQITIATVAPPNIWINRITTPSWTATQQGDISTGGGSTSSENSAAKVAGRSAMDSVTAVDTTSTIPPYVNVNFIIKT